MGGFAMMNNCGDVDGAIPGHPHLTLTARGMTFLAENGIIPNISERLIKDKSKANSFAKALTCVQGGWLIIECISRLCYKLPVTLLELNTAGHVLCAVAMYWFWGQSR